MDFSSQRQETFAVTTPLFYVNDLPHVGSAYPTIAADILARFERMRGKSVLFVTGTDEHGQKIQRAAESKHKSPQVYSDEISSSFVALWQQLNIQYDRFSRTTAPNHEAIVKEFFERVWKKGDIYRSQQKGWYCVACEEFKEERELLSDHFCSIHTNKQAEWRDEENYFFRLSNYQSKLEAFYQAHPYFIAPQSRRNEVLNFVAQGLQDFSISRVNLDWGFPVPIDPSHTLYVWFDALLGYITALLEPGAEPTLENALAKWWPVNLHLIGKDILRFHAIYWPAMLMSAELDLPQVVFGHGFLTKDNQKMGKTLGNTLDPVALVEQYGSDAVRYFFIKAIEFGKDGDFSQTRFVEILNSDLANNLGNLLNRTSKMALKYGYTHVPNLTIETIADDNPLKIAGMALGQEVVAAYETLAFSKACELILNLAHTGNEYIDDQKPWTLYKEGKIQKLEQVLYAVLESVRLSAYLLSPVIPNIANDIYQQLGLATNFNDKSDVFVTAPFAIHASWGILSCQQQLGDPHPVFRSLEINK